MPRGASKLPEKTFVFAFILRMSAKTGRFIHVVINLNVVLSVERETYQLTVLNTDEQRNTRFGGEKMIIL